MPIVRMPSTTKMMATANDEDHVDDEDADNDDDDNDFYRG